MKELKEMTSVVLTEKLAKFCKDRYEKWTPGETSFPIGYGFQVTDDITCNIEIIKIWQEKLSPMAKVIMDVYFFSETEKNIEEQGSRARYMCCITPALHAVIVYKLKQLLEYNYE